MKPPIQRFWMVRLARRILQAGAESGPAITAPLFTRIPGDCRTLYRLCRSEGIVLNLERSPVGQEELPPGICQALATENCADTNRWRAELIKAARHNVLISGGYCGGDSFRKLLDLIAQRFREYPDLKVIILSSPAFINRDCDERLRELARLYPRNFSLVETPLVWHLSPGLKKATNHAKCTVVDYGRYFILGGSCITDNWADDGLDGLTSGPSSHAATTGYTVKIPAHPAGPYDRQQRIQYLVDRLMAMRFRDMDFVFSSAQSEPGKTPCGQQVYKEMLLLAYRWEQYNLMLANKARRRLRAQDMGVLTGRETSIVPADPLTLQLLKTPIPAWQSIKTKVGLFESCNQKAESVVFKLLASGPQSRRSSFASELVRQLDAARTRIVINHRYFHPSREIMEALVRAARRGVQITIITCGVFPNCPPFNHIFAPRNKYNYAALARALAQDERCRLKVYEFQQNRKAIHKKVIVIDDVVLAGSSNLGYKSLVSTSDHELDFSARSRRFAEETLRVCQEDMEYCIEIGDPAALTPRDYYKAFLHRCLAPLID